jgi:hypothetical protein
MPESHRLIVDPETEPARVAARQAVDRLHRHDTGGDVIL